MIRRQSITRGISTVLLIAMLMGCGSSGRPESLAIDAIGDAVAAVEERFGADPSFYEINATSDGVNLFVRVADAGSSPRVVQARYTSSDGLVVSEEAVPAEGSVFSGSDVDFDARTIIERAVAQLSTSTPRVFAITASSPTAGGGTASLVYRLVMESKRGGRLVVLLGRDGSILGSDVLD